MSGIYIYILYKKVRISFISQVTDFYLFILYSFIKLEYIKLFLSLPALLARLHHHRPRFLGAQ